MRHHCGSDFSISPFFHAITSKGGKMHMATNEPNKPDNVINIDTAKTQAGEKATPDQPLQTGGEAPAPEKTEGTGKTVTPPAPEEKAPEPAKQARRGRPAKADKADQAPKGKPPAEQDGIAFLHLRLVNDG